MEISTKWEPLCNISIFRIKQNGVALSIPIALSATYLDIMVRQFILMLNRFSRICIMILICKMLSIKNKRMKTLERIYRMCTAAIRSSVQVVSWILHREQTICHIGHIFSIYWQRNKFCGSESSKWEYQHCKAWPDQM